MFASEQTAKYPQLMISIYIHQLNGLALNKGDLMNKLTSITLISSILVFTFAASEGAANKHLGHCIESELKSMDTNGDNMVSKDEFMTYNESAFNEMKLTDGKVNLKTKAKSSINGEFLEKNSSIKNKPWMGKTHM